MGKKNTTLHLEKIWQSTILGNRTFRLIVACVIVFSFYSVNIVPSESMDPTLQINDLVAYKRGKDVERQDVVLFKNPMNRKEKYVKRVIAVAGDEVRIDRGEVYVNGGLLNELYVKSAWYPESILLIVPKGTIFVMGDNRNNSMDSREFGPVQTKDIIGRASFRLLPIQRVGKSW